MSLKEQGGPKKKDAMVVDLSYFGKNWTFLTEKEKEWHNDMVMLPADPIVHHFRKRSKAVKPVAAQPHAPASASHKKSVKSYFSKRDA